MTIAYALVISRHEKSNRELGQGNMCIKGFVAHVNGFIPRVNWQYPIKCE